MERRRKQSITPGAEGEGRAIKTTDGLSSIGWSPPSWLNALETPPMSHAPPLQGGALAGFEHLLASDLLLGEDPAMRVARERILRYANDDRPVLIQGEPGTGKDVAAKAIHLAGPRRERPWVFGNLAGLGDTAWSEIFGHRKGAWTGAFTDHDGLFLEAHGTSLMLSEVTAIPMGIQAMVLRAIEKKCFRPMKARREVHSDARVIAMTNELIPEAIAGGRFRDDLYYRLNVLGIVLPPLRARLGDLGLLVLSHRDRWGFLTKYTYAQVAQAPWLRNLVATVEKPSPDGGPDDVELVESFTYTDDELGNVRTHATRARVPGGAGPIDRTTTFSYDPVTAQLTEILFPDVSLPNGGSQENVRIVNTYGGERRQLTSVLNEENHTITFYDFHTRHGLPRRTLREGGTEPEEAEFDDMGNMVSTRRPTGGMGNEIPGSTIYDRDGLYRVKSVKDAAGFFTFNSYDLESRLIKVQPPAGGFTEMFYDRRGLISRVDSPDGFWTQAVDANGNMRRKSSLRGHFTFMKYDPLDRPVDTRVQAKSLFGAGGTNDIQTKWVHDGFDGAVHFATHTRVGIGYPDRITKTLFDNRARAIRIIAPDQNTISETFYNEQDQVLATQTVFNSAFQTATVMFRDKRDRVERVRIQGVAYPSLPPAALRSDTVTIFNRVGSVVQAVDPLGDPLDSSFARKVTQELDARERVIKVRDGFGHVVSENSWGDDDLLVELRVPEPETKSNLMVTSERRTYTKRKEIKSVKNRDGHGLTTTYNAIQGQVDTLTDAFGRITKTTYDLNTQRIDEIIVAYQTARERRTKSVWVNGLLTETRVYNPESGTNNAVFRRFYDQADRLERFEAPLVSPETYAYNEFGEGSVVVMGSKTLTHQYSALGQRVQTTWSGGVYNEVETRTYV